MDVILKYASGFDTRLKNHSYLASLLKRDGPPTRIEGFTLWWDYAVDKYAASWHYDLKNPWSNDSRKLIKVHLDE